MGNYGGVEHIGQAIRLRRNQLGLTLKEAESQLGVTDATISRWETGEIEVRELDHLGRVFQFLEVDQDEAAWLVFRNRIFYGQRRLRDASSTASALEDWLRAHPRDGEDPSPTPELEQ